MGDRQVIKINESQFRQIISESIFNFFNRKKKVSVDSDCTIKTLETKKELIDICYLFEENFQGYTAEWFYGYVTETGLNPKCSYIAVSENGDVEGACVVTEEEFPVEILNRIDFRLSRQLFHMKHKCISLLVVKPQYRGGNLNYQLVKKVVDCLKNEGCEWIYIQVLNNLKTHDYWKRYGSVEFLEYEGVKNYMLPISDNAKKVSSCIYTDLLNEYLDRMASSAMRSLGTVDKPSDLAKGTYRQLRSDTWNPQKGKAGIQKNSWLVHITDKETGYEIMKNGFMSKLSDLNFRATQDEDFTNKLSKNGLCFAFELERDDSWVYELDEYKEDCCAIIFQANGFNAFSSFGDLYEVIFNANSAHNLLMVLPMSDEENERYLRHHPDTKDLFIGVKMERF